MESTFQIDQFIPKLDANIINWKSLSSAAAKSWVSLREKLSNNSIHRVHEIVAIWLQPNQVFTSACGHNEIGLGLWKAGLDDDTRADGLQCRR